MLRWLTATIAFAWIVLGPLTEGRADVELRVGRFFGPCPEAGTDAKRVSGEACIIQAILNAFSAEDNGVTIDMLPADWDRYYDQLKASYDVDAPPDIHVLHRHRLPEFVELGFLASLGADLPAAGIDFSDWETEAFQAVTADNKIFGVPFDIHANLWHLNLGVLAKAGLVGSDGRAILPASPGELLEHAERVQESTGKAYLAADFIQFPIGIRAILSLLWQQDQNILSGGEALIDTPEMRAAITTVTDLFDAGYANPAFDYESAQQAFLDGEAAVLINGTWVVDLYDREASKAEVSLTDYDVANFPTLFDREATWADSHLWAVPARLKTEQPEIYDAALKLLAHINEHNLDWARTGHLAVRSSVLESEDYGTLPHRPDYRHSAVISSDIPPLRDYTAVQEILTNALQSILKGEMSLDEALAGAEAEVQSFLQ